MVGKRYAVTFLTNDGNETTMNAVTAFNLAGASEAGKHQFQWVHGYWPTDAIRIEQQEYAHG